MEPRLAAGLACALCAGTLYFSQSPAQAPRDGRAPVVCTGNLVQASNMVWDQRKVEFTLDHTGNAQATTLKSNIGSLNGLLLVESSPDFLVAKEAQPRPIGSDDRSLAISELKISRNTGAFTMAVSLFRNLDVLEGKSLWEGTCARKSPAEKKL
jgi:hypothetical protein